MTNNRNFTQDYTSFNIKKWKEWLFEYINKENILGLEIGCYEGRSSCWFCENILTGKNSVLYCNDVWNWGGIEQKFDNNIVGLNINKLKGDSLEILPKLIYNKVKFNFIYVDGCHLASHVLSDMCFSWELLVNNGIMICDDYIYSRKDLTMPPGKAIDSWLLCNFNSIKGYEINSVGLNYAQCAIWKK